MSGTSASDAAAMRGAKEGAARGRTVVVAGMTCLPEKGLDESEIDETNAMTITDAVDGRR